jgi:hypothetical protein
MLLAGVHAAGTRWLATSLLQAHAAGAQAGRRMLSIHGDGRARRGCGRRG